MHCCYCGICNNSLCSKGIILVKLQKKMSIMEEKNKFFPNNWQNLVKRKSPLAVETIII